MPLPRRVPFLVAGLLAACAPASQDTAQAPVADAAADRARLDEIVASLDAAYSAEDFQTAQSHFAENIVHLPPAEDAVVGAAAVRARDSAFSADYDDQLASKIEDAVVDGDWAVARLTYTENWAPKVAGKGEARSAAGKTLLVLRRQGDGSWKITHYMWNSSRPRT